jgi:pyruvate/2-oxoglutarate dehydrogenase complex dihydrolipoamide dehydrogenase (E3) component
MSSVDRAVCDSADQGFMKIICLKKNNKVLGATIVAAVAGEMISEIGVLMKADMPFDELANVMHPYPTYTMGLQLMAADAYYEKTMKLKWLYAILNKLGL